MKRKLLLIFSFAQVAITITAHAQSGKSRSLFTPKNKSEWYTFIAGAGRNNDSFHVFSFEKDVLHVSGERFGYISTQKAIAIFN